MFSPPCPRPRRAAPRRRALLPCSSVPAHPHPHPPAALASPGAPLLSRLIASSRSRASTPTFLASRAHLHLIQLSGTISGLFVRTQAPYSFWERVSGARCARVPSSARASAGEARQLCCWAPCRAGAERRAREMVASACYCISYKSNCVGGRHSKASSSAAHLNQLA